MRRVAALVLMALLAGACSVSNPRHGVALRSTSGETSRTASAGGGADGSDVEAGLAPEDGGIVGVVDTGSGVSSTGGGERRAGSSSSAPIASSSGAPSSGASRSGAEPLRASDVGVTQGTITISHSSIYSGPYGPLVSSIVDSGIGTWVDDVNASGGINGRKVVVKRIDNRGTADGGIAACKQEQSNGTFLSFISAGEERPEADCLDAAGIPALTLFSGSLNDRWRRMHALTLTPGGGTALASFVPNVLHARAEKIGVLWVRQGLFEAAAKGFVSAAKGVGLKIVNQQAVDQNQASFIAELQRMRSAGVTVAVVFVFTEILGVMRDARAINYAPKVTGAGFHVDEFTTAGRNLMDGVTTMRPFATFDSPAYPAFVAKARKAGQTNTSSSAAAAYGAGLVLGRALTLAGRNPTRATVAAAFETLKLDTDILPPMSWRPGDPLGSRSWYPAICCHPDYTWKSLGPPKSQF